MRSWGSKDLTIAATSLGEAHDPIAEYIEAGKVVGIQTSGIRGRMGQVVSEASSRPRPSSAATAAVARD